VVRLPTTVEGGTLAAMVDGGKLVLADEKVELRRLRLRTLFSRTA
jgi:hypothetical protein